MKLECKDITVLIGENDAGKSNILRALNLFFNGETDYGSPFDFDRDWNRKATRVAKKAKEIRISLTIALPTRYYVRTNEPNLPESVVWEKRWHEDGLKSEKQEYSNKKKFRPRNKISILLNRIRFRYVPAVKDRSFFAKLQGELYEVLTQVVDDKLRESAASFEDSIKEELEELHKNGVDILGSVSSLKLPENLRPIFETLQFFGEDDIPLQQRGDGIQMRHIPAVLNFMGEKHNSVRAKGSPNYTYIWGYEEPENSVEMGACFKMRTTLEDIITHSKIVSRIFLTTHSPIFYRMGSQEGQNAIEISRYIIRKPNLHSEAETTDIKQLDETMGLMPLISPYIEDERQRRQKAEQALGEARHLLETAGSKPTLFVEGKWDKQIVEKALSLFFPDTREQIQVKECGGIDNVKSRAKAWKEWPPAINQNIPAVALIDGSERDDPYRTEKTNRSRKQVLNLVWAPNNCVRKLKTEESAQLRTDLESCYSDTVWRHAEEQEGWLEDSECLHEPRQPLRQIDMYESTPSLRRNPSSVEKVRMTKRFTEEGKKRAVRYIVNLPAVEAKEALKAMHPTLEKAVRHLVPPQPPASPSMSRLPITTAPQSADIHQANPSVETVHDDSENL